MVSLLLLLACGSSLRHIQAPPTGLPSTLPPYRTRALYLTGALAMERQDPQTAVTAFSMAALLDPESPIVLLALADAEDAAGDRKAASRHRQRAAELE